MSNKGKAPAAEADLGDDWQRRQEEQEAGVARLIEAGWPSHLIKATTCLTWRTGGRWPS
jgi:hypothetical protein